MSSSMSDSQFDRSDWRPSRRRATSPRVRDWGGQKQASPAFLAHRAKPGAFGQPGLRLCDHCQRPAMRQTSLCRFHCGPRAVMALGRPYRRNPRQTARDSQALD